MRFSYFSKLLMIIAFVLAVVTPNMADSIVPSAEILGLPSNTGCTGGSYDVPVQYNMPYITNIVGVMSVDGVGVVQSYDQDVSRTDLGSYFLGSTVFSVPSGTVITIKITTYNTTDKADGAAYEALLVFECGTGNIVSFTNGTPLSVGVPHLGLVQISSPVMAYEAPGGNPIRDSSGAALMLPNDADHSGYDTYVVTDAVLYNGEQWVYIFLGSANFVAVPFNQVTLLEGDLTFK